MTNKVFQSFYLAIIGHNLHIDYFNSEDENSHHQKKYLMPDTLDDNLNFTIEFWIKLTGSGVVYFQSLNDPNNAYSANTHIDILTTSTLFRLDLNNSTMDINTDMTTYYNIWTHFAITYDNSVTNNSVFRAEFLYHQPFQLHHLVHLIYLGLILLESLPFLKQKLL